LYVYDAKKSKFSLGKKGGRPINPGFSDIIKKHKIEAKVGHKIGLMIEENSFNINIQYFIMYIIENLKLPCVRPSSVSLKAGPRLATHRA
jgi:hypothetical protein